MNPHYKKPFNPWRFLTKFSWRFQISSWVCNYGYKAHNIVTVYQFRHEPAQNLWRFSKFVAINKFRISFIAQGEKSKIDRKRKNVFPRKKIETNGKIFGIILFIHILSYLQIIFGLLQLFCGLSPWPLWCWWATVSNFGPLDIGYLNYC